MSRVGLLLDTGDTLCQKCGFKIDQQQEGINAAGFNWHSNCFTCSSCNAPINDSFVEQFSRVFCVPCERKLFGQYCGEKLGVLESTGCGKLISGEFLQANGHYFHPDCLLCTNCKQPSNKVGEFFLANNQLMCAFCVQQLSKK